MQINTRNIVKIAIISALSYVIMFLEVPMPFIPPFLKIDISEVPVLLTAFSLGPISAIMIELIKNILHVFNSQTAGIGEIANFFIGISFVVPSSLIYIKNKNKRNAVVGLVVGTLSMVIVASTLNYFVLLPLYAKVLGFTAEMVIGLANKINPIIVDVKTFIIFAIIPFNIIKGFVVSIIVVLIYKKLSFILHN